MLEEIACLIAEEEIAIAEHRAMKRAYEKIREKLVLKSAQEEVIADDETNLNETN